MPNYRRYYIPNAIIFITCVTKDRYPYLKSTEDVGLFIDTIENAKKINPFDLLAYVFYQIISIG
jgi:REP element-mobilizing transposase RayT